MPDNHEAPCIIDVLEQVVGNGAILGPRGFDQCRQIATQFVLGSGFGT